MEKIKRSKGAQLFDKLAVESEPGLTNAQLLLTNHDLKPGMPLILTQSETRTRACADIHITVEPERRQWGPWNFVGFWVADSFNIVCLPSSTHRNRRD